MLANLGVQHFQVHRRRNAARRNPVEDIPGSLHELLAPLSDLGRVQSSNWLASCAIVLSSRNAASATLALNAAVNLRRVFFANFVLISENS